MANKQSVKVVVRIRPALGDDKLWVQVINKSTLQTLNHRNTRESIQYQFQSVYGPETNQIKIYDSVSPLIKHLFNGQNSSVFAYGPTGAGKTYTVLGTPQDPGIIPRCIKDIFNFIQEESTEWKFTVSFSYLEIYQEKVQDLLEPKKACLPIREDQHRNIHVVGLCEKAITSVDEFNCAFGPASKNRTTAATKLNERSSRSHSILMFKVQKTQKVAPFKRLTGKIYLVDLAGSEDNRRTGNKGVRLKESGAINSSLLALGQVVDALNRGQTCVSYRSSKLTRLLQDSLGGSAHSLMIVNIAPEERHYFHTYTTLLFARKAKNVVNTIKTNESMEKTPEIVQKDVKSKTPPDESEATPAKRRKLSEPTPFLSPLLRNQEKFKFELKEEMCARLEDLEERLLLQMKGKVLPPVKCAEVSDEDKPSIPDSTTPPGGEAGAEVSDEDKPSIPDSTTPPGGEAKALQNVQNLMDKMQDLKKEQIKDSSRSNKQTNMTDRLDLLKFSLKNRKKYKDGSEDQPIPIHQLTSSPLFLRHAPKTKGFVSTASTASTAAKRKWSFDTPIKEKRNKATVSAVSNPALQKEHNAKILELLNTGSLKDLQTLQTVGLKRAQLIYNWRQLNGAFLFFDDLKKVHGLAIKYVDKFLACNLVQYYDSTE